MITASEKKEFRKLYLLRREQVAQRHPEYQERLNAAIFDWLKKEKITSIGFYWPFRAEPDISSAIRAWLGADAVRRASLPVIEDKIRGTMHYAVWKPESIMRVGAFGIAIPQEDVRAVPEILFLPCIAFSRKGVRLGSGAGFFDRYLAYRNRDAIPPVTVAVSFESLQCNELAAEPHDILFDWIATEAGVRRVG